MTEILAVVALLGFLAAFVLIIMRLLRPGARAAARRHGEIPFRDDPPAPTPPGPQEKP